jgi:hypothetical protein
MKKYIYTLLLLISSQLLPSSPPPTSSYSWGSFSTPSFSSDDLRNALLIGGVGYVTNKLYNWYQGTQQRQKDMDRVLEGTKSLLAKYPNPSQEQAVINIIKNALAFFAFKHPSYYELSNASMRYKDKHSKEYEKLPFKILCRDIWNIDAHFCGISTGRETKRQKFGTNME